MDELKIWIIVAQIINFSVLLFVFKYFLWDKIVKIIEERKIKLKEIELSEETVKNKLKEADLESNKILEEARLKVSQMESDSQALIARNKINLMSSAKEEADSIISAAEKEVEKGKISMLNLMKEKIVSVSLKINERLFNDKKINNDFIDKEMKDLFDLNKI